MPGRPPYPMVDDHRPPEGRLAGRSPRLTGRHDPRAVLDGSCAEQYLPVVAPGPLSEVRRDGEDLSTGQGQRPVQLREAKVVADGHPHAHTVDVRADRFVAG